MSEQPTAEKDACQMDATHALLLAAAMLERHYAHEDMAFAVAYLREAASQHALDEPDAPEPTEGEGWPRFGCPLHREPRMGCAVCQRFHPEVSP